MSIIQAIVLGLLQGATEFIPVSSSGHLVLIPWLFHWTEPGLAFDVIVHWGTAFAVLGYFWQDWLTLTRASWQAIRRRTLEDPQARLALFIMIGTIPAALAGLFLEDFFESMFARPAAAAAFLLITAAILSICERISHQTRELENLVGQDALAIGTAQALAIFPGISRSGSTIAAGLGMKLKREAAARFSFLLATPVILGAGLLQLVDLAEAGHLSAQLPLLSIGFITALLSGLACIHFLLRYLKRRPLYPFAIYCAAFGSVCLLIALGR